MRKIIYILLIPALLYGAVKGLLWYQVKSRMDQLVEQAGMFAEVSYDGIHTSVLGEVGVNNLIIKPRMANDQIAIDAVRVSAPDILYFLSAAYRLHERKMPERFGVAFEKIRVDLNGQLIRMMSQMQQQAPAQRRPSVLERLDALGCGEVGSFGLDDVIRMGYDEVVLDLAMNMKYEETSNRFTIDMDVRDRDIYRVTASMDFDMDLNSLQVNPAAAPQPNITHANLQYTDSGYHKLRNAFCAKQNNSSVEAYVDRTISMLNGELGTRLPQNIDKALRGYLTNGGRISLTIKPDDPAALSGLHLYSAKDAMALLGMTIKINGVTLTGDTIPWDGQLEADAVVHTDAVQQPTTAEPPPQPAPATRPPQQIAEPAGGYQTVDTGELHKYLNRQIRVATRSGKQRSGRLNLLEDDVAYIEMELRGHSLTFPVKLAEITQAELLVQ